MLPGDCFSTPGRTLNEQFLFVSSSKQCWDSQASYKSWEQAHVAGVRTWLIIQKTQAQAYYSYRGIMSPMSQAPEMSECLNPRGGSENKNARNESRGRHWNLRREACLRRTWEVAMRAEWQRQDPEDACPWHQQLEGEEVVKAEQKCSATGSGGGRGGSEEPFLSPSLTYKESQLSVLKVSPKPLPRVCFPVTRPSFRSPSLILSGRLCGVLDVCGFCFHLPQILKWD